jgi:hypothetical protein
MTDEQLARYQKYFTEGREYIAGLKVGDYYDGVWPEADRRGYQKHTEERKWFTNGAIAELPEFVVTTPDGVIVEPLKY